VSEAGRDLGEVHFVRRNLAGDDANFVRFDPASGEITHHGTMHRRYIKAEQDAGGAIIETSRHDVALGKHRIDLGTMEVVDYEPPVDHARRARIEKEQALAHIRQMLAHTDRYFTADALDNIDAKTQASWRSYRKALRAAAKMDSAQAMLAALPDNPKPEQPEIM
jgi:hypothetical protein